ncbi:MAG: transporter substrate-binding domain-containing protein [Bacillota bacterium]
MRKIKNILIALLVLGVLIFAAGCGGTEPAPNPPAPPANGQEATPPEKQEAAKDTLDVIKDRGVFVAGLDDGYPPMGFRDEKNELVGFDIDMGNEIASRLGVKMEWQPTDWDGVIPSLKTKRFDVIISGMTITPLREEEVNFTIPYVKAGVVALVKAGNKDGIQEPMDLSGKIVGIQGGSSGEDAVIELEEMEGFEKFKDVKRYKQFPECLEDLAIGRTDAAIVDNQVAAHFLDLRPGVYEIATPVNVEYFAIAVRKEDTKLLEELNRLITEMKADGFLLENSLEWFEGDVIPE